MCQANDRGGQRRRTKTGKGRHGQQRRPENCNLTPQPLSATERGVGRCGAVIDVSGSPLLSWRGAGGIGVKRINGGMKWPFVIRGHKPSMGRPSPFRERGLGVRAKLPVSRTLKSPNCGDCARGSIRHANAVPSPQPSPKGRGWSTPVLPAQFRRLTPMGAGGEDIYTIVGCWMRPVSRRVNAQGSFSDLL